MRAILLAMQAVSMEFTLAGTQCSLETGRIARQAGAAVLGRSGDTVILATVVAAPEPRPGADFFPLTVEYREKLAAVGIIPGTYNRREGRISDQEVLMSRLIDRSLRSLFPASYRAEVQVQVSVLSADPANDPTTLALLAATAAVHLSPAPAKGPAAGLRIVGTDAGFSTFPSLEKRAAAKLDFVVSAGPDGLVMVEGEAKEATEAECSAALDQALAWLQKVQKQLVDFAKQAGKTKYALAEEPLLPSIPSAVQEELSQALSADKQSKAERSQLVQQIKDTYLQGLDETEQAEAAAALRQLHTQLVREAILADQRRPDGRGAKDIRPIWSEVAWLPRPHGSAIFTRGETQALVTCTLGTAQDAQRLESLTGKGETKFILHYNFPPYSVNEARPLRGPGRREIGHGHLARRGLTALLPMDQDYPYTIRLESEISESNGSSSMATVCGSSMALMQAGVPLRAAVAGIAMGMVADDNRCVVLSDILGEEDHLGDMDFKVVGTNQGITALQLDNKIGGLSSAKLAEALSQAREGRLHILKEMAKSISSPAKEMSLHAPRVVKTSILPESIGALVGARGANIREIQERSAARVSVDDHGQVLIYAADGNSASKALRMVQQLVGVIKAEHYYNGTITGVKDFGSFVKINEVNEGLVPNEELPENGDWPEGKAVVVKVLGADDRGRLRLSISAALGVDPALIQF